MVIVRCNTIMISKGETFQTLFYMSKEGYNLTGNEVIKFNVKKSPSDKNIVLMLTCGIDTLNNIISVYGTDDEMSILQARTYFYDLIMYVGKARYTLSYPAKLIVREVCYE